MNEECLVCKAPLEYLDTNEIMECAICRKKQSSKARCVNGHFICDECHTSGMADILSACFKSKSKNPATATARAVKPHFAPMISQYSSPGSANRLSFFPQTDMGRTESHHKKIGQHQDLQQKKATGSID